MKSAEFKIPTNKESKTTEQNTKNGYNKVVENVYIFDGVSLDINNMNLLFNLALQYKHVDINNALTTFKHCEDKINETTDKTIVYEIYVNMALLYTVKNDYNTLKDYYYKAMKVCPERSEPYYYLSLYCNKNKLYDKSYELLKYSIKNLSYDIASTKYGTVQQNAYGKYLYEELALACYMLSKYDESIKCLENIIDDSDFANIKDKLNNKLCSVIKKMEK